MYRSVLAPCRRGPRHPHRSVPPRAIPGAFPTTPVACQLLGVVPLRAASENDVNGERFGRLGSSRPPIPSPLAPSPLRSGRTFKRPHSEQFAGMADRTTALSVLIALEFVVVSAVVFLLVPFEVAVPLVPLSLVFLLALLKYRS